MKHWTVKTGSSKNKTDTRSHQTDRTLMVKINQALTAVGSIQGGVPLSRVNTNPNDDDDDEYHLAPEHTRIYWATFDL